MLISYLGKLVVLEKIKAVKSVESRPQGAPIAEIVAAPAKYIRYSMREAKMGAHCQEARKSASAYRLFFYRRMVNGRLLRWHCFLTAKLRCLRPAFSKIPGTSTVVELCGR